MYSFQSWVKLEILRTLTCYRMTRHSSGHSFSISLKSYSSTHTKWLNLKWSPGQFRNRILIHIQFKEDCMTFCLCRDKEEGAKSVFIGAAVYPTLAMFNHSCDPSIVRYHINRVLCDKLSSCKCTTPLEFGRHQFYSGFMSKTRFASKPSRIFPKARRFLRTTGQSFSIPAERTERYELRLKIG